MRLQLLRYCIKKNIYSVDKTSKVIIFKFVIRKAMFLNKFIFNTLNLTFYLL